jgi:hypothetical protein
MVFPSRRVERAENMNKRRVAAFGAVATVGLVALAVAALAVPARHSGSNVNQVKTATDGSPVLLSGIAPQNVPGASVTANGPSSGSAFLVIRFSGSGDCRRPEGTKIRNYCRARILVNGQQAQPASNGVCGTPIMNTQRADHMPDVYDPTESFILERTFGPFGSGPLTVQAQTCADGSLLLQNWTLVAERVTGS